VLPTYYAVLGGSYDLLTRHEEALLVWIVLALGFAFGLLPRARLHRLSFAVLAAVAALALLTALSLTWTESDGRTTEELARVVQYAGIVLLALSALNRYTWRAAAAGLVAAGLVVCAAAVGARVAPGLFPDPTAELFDSKRLSYPLDYWNATAAWGAMSIAGALAWSAHARTPLLRASALALVPVAGLAVYLSYSRAGVGGTAVAALLVLTLSRNRWTALAHIVVAAGATALVILVARAHPEIAEGSVLAMEHRAAGAGVVVATLVATGAVCAAVAFATAAAGIDRARMAKQPARIAVALCALAALLVAVTAGRGPISDAWDQFQNQSAVNVGQDPTARLGSLGGGRDEVWDAAIAAYESEPLTGIGPGSFEFWWSRTSETGAFARDAHSLYLEQLAELGIPGLLLLLAFLGTLLSVGLQVRLRSERSVDAGASAAMVAMFGVFLFHAGVDWMWELTAVTTLGLAAAAVAAAGSSSRRRSPLAMPVRTAVVVVCLAATVIQVPGLVSTARTRESETTLDAGDLSGARELADEAIEAQPWAAEPYVQRATVAEAQGDLAAARDDLHEAIERQPTDWRPHILLAQVELQLDDIPAARAAFAQAKRLHPYSTLYTTFPVFQLQILGGPEAPTP
jgi:tetratricopeptide (TPR) repeat protein